MPTSGLIAIVYRATWEESVAGAARAAIFIGNNQLKITPVEADAPVTTAAAPFAGEAHQKGRLFSCDLGLVATSGHSHPTGDVTTGQAIGCFTSTTSSFKTCFELNGVVETIAQTTPLGGPCYVFAAAGEYEVQVRFKVTSSDVKVSNRKLWVWSMF
jgi:hypothetical protein